jgi:hypothetical protein
MKLLDNSPASECRRPFEPPPSLAQGLRHRHLIAGLPAGHRADGEMKRRLVVVPDSIEQSPGACDVARASHSSLEPGEPPYIALRGRMGGIKRQEELRRIAQFLEVDSEIVLRTDIELPEMRATLVRLAMQSHQIFSGKRRHRLRQDGQRFAADLVAPAAAAQSRPARFSM